MATLPIYNMTPLGRISGRETPKTHHFERGWSLDFQTDCAVGGLLHALPLEGLHEPRPEHRGFLPMERLQFRQYQTISALIYPNIPYFGHWWRRFLLEYGVSVSPCVQFAPFGALFIAHRCYFRLAGSTLYVLEREEALYVTVLDNDLMENDTRIALNQLPDSNIRGSLRFQKNSPKFWQFSTIFDILLAIWSVFGVVTTRACLAGPLQITVPVDETVLNFCRF